MENEVDKTMDINLCDRVLDKYEVNSWSFDKGFYSTSNKEILELFINHLVMPKKVKLNKEEKAEESEAKFKKTRNKHSAVNLTLTNKNTED